MNKSKHIIETIKVMLYEKKEELVSEIKALIIIDYTDQNVNKNEKPEWGLLLNKVKAIRSNIIKLINICRSKNYPIIFIGTKEWSEKQLPTNINHLYKTNPDATFYSTGKDSFIIKPEINDQIFLKNSYSAFSGTQGKLDKYLKKIGINNLIICGIYTTGCVKDTIAEAFAKGYHLIIVKDCIETFDREDKQQYQKILLNDWPYMYGPVINCDQVK